MFGAGALLTGGLGAQTLTTRGMGAFIVELVQTRPRQLHHRGGSGRRDDVIRHRLTIVSARLVEINGVDVLNESRHVNRIEANMDAGITMRVVGFLRETKRRTKNIVINARPIKKCLLCGQRIEEAKELGLWHGQHEPEETWK